ncbi:MAG: beta-ketoacyl-ACP synthase III [Neptuniibacter caesariensis]|uniref:Beta-ketoacyl-ACP synthase III n=1 Tax=Neptuniibacter caesariensis TaxID=207954 RepID=A0A2G6JJP7_NEPCE|nr:MAG: beta-ketoacyl-ACP synthase III [Neptuniibacter caesariensis]
MTQQQTPIVISGFGLWNPEYSISNEELVSAYNAYANNFNQHHAAEIEQGSVNAKPLSSAEFITKASGIKNRYVYRKEGALDPERMRPYIEPRENSELSHQAEMAVNAARKALSAAHCEAADIDAVIVACSYTQRAYPAIAIEVQHELGISGFGFDMLVACSSATFSLQRAYEMVKAGTATRVLVISPELTSPQNNWRDRDSHFIFGDVAVATVVESADSCRSDESYEILGSKAATLFSNNIRSNFGYLSYTDDSDPFGEDKFFIQNGRKVFKEVCPMAAEHITSQLKDLGIDNSEVKRWWLHQANINMNLLIAKKLLGREASAEEAPIVLDQYANTASAGSLIAFNLHREGLESGDLGVICSFGAGYSIGSLVIRKR